MKIGTLMAASVSCLVLTTGPLKAEQILTEVKYIGKGEFHGQKFQSPRWSLPQVGSLAERACAKIDPSRSFVLLQRRSNKTQSQPARFDFECFNGQEMMDDPRSKEKRMKKPYSFILNKF
jgi:hypothetical protein